MRGLYGQYVAKGIIPMPINTKLIQLKAHLKVERIPIIDSAPFFLTIFFFGTRSLYKAVLYNNSLKLRFKYLWANNATTIIFLLIEKLNEPLVLINL